MSSLKKSSAKSASSRGGAQRAELTEEQKQEIKEAFDLFDTGQIQKIHIHAETDRDALPLLFCIIVGLHIYIHLYLFGLSCIVMGNI
jgi:hypothetical protein